MTISSVIKDDDNVRSHTAHANYETRLKQSAVNGDAKIVLLQLQLIQIPIGARPIQRATTQQSEACDDDMDLFDDLIESQHQ